MKKLIMMIGACLAIAIASAQDTTATADDVVEKQEVANDETQSATSNRLASVYKVNGVYVFTDCEPVEDYEIVTRKSVAISFISDQYTAVRDKLIRKAVNEYPDADGVLLSFVDGGIDRAAVIKFKTATGMKRSRGMVNRVNGVLVFTDSEPEAPYTVIGRERVAIGLSEQYTAVRNQLIRKVVRHYPEADGAILTFVNGGVDRAVAIKFK